MADKTITGEVFRLKNAEDDKVGLDASLTVENGNILLNFGKPVQYITLDKDDTARWISSFLEAGFAAFIMEKHAKKDKLN